MNPTRAALAKMFGLPTPQGGNVPGFPDAMIGNPYRLERLAWDYPKAVRLVATVRACVLRIADDMAQMPIVFERQRGADWEAVERAPGNIVDIWARANDEQTNYELVRDLHAHLVAAGNAYLVAETFGTRKVRELWLMNPHLVRVIPGPRRKLAAYEFDRGGAKEVVPGEFVIHFRGFTPDFEPVGGSDLESVEQQYTTRYDVGRLMQLFVRGGGIPAGYFKLIGADGKPAAQAMDEPTSKSLIASLGRVFSGVKNAFRPKILSQLEWDRMGLTPDEMKLIEISGLCDADVCRATGVPPWMVGIKEQAGKLGDSGGAALQDRSIYIINTLLPKVAMRDGVLSEKLCPMFEVGIRARTDLSGVRELVMPLLNVAQDVVALTGGPVLTTNQARKIFGLPPDPNPDADVLREPRDPLAGFGLSPVGAKAETPVPEAKPAPVSELKARMIDGDEGREMQRKRAAANLVRYERKVAALFASILEAQQQRIIARLRADDAARGRNGHAARALSIEDIVAEDPDDKAALELLLAQLVRDRGEEALADLALTVQVNVNSGRAAAFVNSQAQRALSQIDATTREAVRKQIAAGLLANETTGEIVARISGMAEFGQARALMIARTETVSAYNFAAMDAYEQSGVVDGMEWLSARDVSVRPTHAEADGQTASLGVPFTVGGYAMDFPGDPGAPPEETINCRCTVLPVVNERARARRQFKATMARLLGTARREGACDEG